MREIFGKVSVWVLVIVSVGVLTLGIYLISRLAPSFLEELPSRRVQKLTSQAPDFSSLNLNGDRVNLSDFREQRIIINFWTSWNETSLEQLKSLNNYYKSSPYDDLVILAINNQESIETVRNITNDYIDSLIVLLDIGGEIGYLYDVSVVPFMVFIDKSGFLRDTVIGPVSSKEIDDRVSLLR